MIQGRRLYHARATLGAIEGRQSRGILRKLAVVAVCAWWAGSLGGDAWLVLVAAVGVGMTALGGGFTGGGS